LTWVREGSPGEMAVEPRSLKVTLARQRGAEDVKLIWYLPARSSQSKCSYGALGYLLPVFQVSLGFFC